jgi:hypothetical protein
MLLGDAIEQALTKVGITSEKVSAFLGRPCSCKKRRDKLNRLHSWAARVLSGKTEDAEKHLDKITGEETK